MQIAFDRYQACRWDDAFQNSYVQKLKRKKNQDYISMHKPLDLLLLLGHHDFYEMDSGYKETLTTLYFIVHMTGIYQPFKTHQIIFH